MTTKVYGYSDDLIEIEGDIDDEIHVSRKARVTFNDGTVLRIGYGKNGKGIWAIEVIKAGTLFESITRCSDEADAIYSDVVTFKDGLTSLAVSDYENL